MRITGLSSPRASAPTRKRSGVTSVNFAALLDLGETTAAQAAAEVAAPAPVSHLLAVQEVEDWKVARQQLASEGEAALHRLEDLRHALLMGRIPVESLHSLSRSLTMQRQQVNDPALLSIIDDIELRVAVELAKLEQSFADEVPAEEPPGAP